MLTTVLQVLMILTQPLCEDHLRHLQGTWKVVEAKAGHDVFTEMFDGVIYEFKGTKVSSTRNEFSSEIQLMVFNRCGKIKYSSTIPGEKNQTIRQTGIYKITKKRLTVCLTKTELYLQKDGTFTVTTQPRPTDFDPSEGTLLIMERTR